MPSSPRKFPSRLRIANYQETVELYTDAIAIAEDLYLTEEQDEYGQSLLESASKLQNIPAGFRSIDLEPGSIAPKEVLVSDVGISVLRSQTLTVYDLEGTAITSLDNVFFQQWRDNQLYIVDVQGNLFRYRRAS